MSGTTLVEELRMAANIAESAGRRLYELGEDAGGLALIASRLRSRAERATAPVDEQLWTQVRDVILARVGRQWAIEQEVGEVIKLVLLSVCGPDTKDRDRGTREGT